MSSDVVVVGGGVIGLATAWRCAQRELRVTLVDPAPGEGASATAAGMLAPVTELHYEGRELLSLNLESARRYPAFAAELQDESGVDVGYRECGTVVAAWDAADLAQLRDHQVDNRQLVRALLKVIDQHHITVVRRPVRRIGREVEVDDGSSIAAATIVLAAGAWSRGLDPDAEVRPVKGQTVRLRTRTDLLNHVVRGSVRGNPVYLVGRAGGELVVGASSEEAGLPQRNPADPGDRRRDRPARRHRWDLGRDRTVRARPDHGGRAVTITVNGEPRTVADGSTLGDLIGGFGRTTQRIAACGCCATQPDAAPRRHHAVASSPTTGMPVL